jgi:hypothetical protein
MAFWCQLLTADLVAYGKPISPDVVHVHLPREVALELQRILGKRHISEEVAIVGTTVRREFGRSRVESLYPRSRQMHRRNSQGIAEGIYI